MATCFDLLEPIFRF